MIDLFACLGGGREILLENRFVDVVRWILLEKVEYF